MTSQSAPSSAVRRLIISQILILVLIGISLVAFQLLYASRPEVQEKQAETASLNVDVFEVSHLDFREVLTGFGTARADREVVLAAQVTGEIVDIHPALKIGKEVFAGRMVTSPDEPSRHRDADLLLKIDPRDYQQRLVQTTNRIAEIRTEIEQLKVQKKNVDRQLAKARAILKTLTTEYERIQEGVKRKASTPSELNRSLLEVQQYEDKIIQLENQEAALPHQLAAAEQRLLTSQSEMTKAETELERTEVEPPFDGVLSEVFVEDGQYVRAGEPLVRLTNLVTVEIPVSLSFDNFLHLESDLASGNRPEVSLAENETAVPRWMGRVVRAAPEADALSRTVQVFVEVTNSEDANPLLPGAFVHSRIDGPSHRETMLIPREAIVDGAVYVVDDNGVARRKAVSPGRRLRSLVIINGGLAPADRVIMTNLDIVKDGEPVIVQTTTRVQDELTGLTASVVRLIEK